MNAAEMLESLGRVLTARERAAATSMRNAMRLWSVAGHVIGDRDVVHVRMNLLRTMQRLEEFVHPALRLPFSIQFD